MLKINHTILEDFSTIPNAFDMNKNLLEAQILFNEYSDVKTLNKTKSFDDNTWQFFELVNHQTYYFHFDSFRPILAFNDKILVSEFILALKCWTIFHLSSKTPISAHKLLRNLHSICQLTKGFQTNFEKLITLIKSGKIYSRRHSKCNDYVSKVVAPETILRYINSFLSFSKFYTDLPVDHTYIKMLEDEKEKVKTSINNRDLPTPKDVLNFKDCIEHFFITYQATPTEKSSARTLTKFFPVILWWDITSIIPMRPSEFCLIRRDCLSLKNNTLTFPRLKQKRNKQNRQQLIYDTLPIPQKLRDKIALYISLTTQYEPSEYLIPFQAFKDLTLKTIKSSVNYEEKILTRDYLQKLISCFYEEIIKTKYNLEINNQLKPGDLRHIAIISLMMQGYDRVEIERLAGHFDINTQYSYSNHMKFWIDTDIQRLTNEFILQKPENFISPQGVEEYEKLYDTLSYHEIMNKNDTTNLDFYELQLGYCMDTAMSCPSFNWHFTGCYFCQHWGISMYDLQRNKELIIKEISTIYNNLQKKINYLAGLYNLHHLDEFGEINPELKTELRRTLEKIEYDKTSIAKLQYLLGVDTNDLK